MGGMGMGMPMMGMPMPSMISLKNLKAAGDGLTPTTPPSGGRNIAKKQETFTQPEDVKPQEPEKPAEPETPAEPERPMTAAERLQAAIAAKKGGVPGAAALPRFVTPAMAPAR